MPTRIDEYNILGMIETVRDVMKKCGLNPEYLILNREGMRLLEKTTTLIKLDWNGYFLELRPYYDPTLVHEVFKIEGKVHFLPPNFGVKNLNIGELGRFVIVTQMGNDSP